MNKLIKSSSDNSNKIMSSLPTPVKMIKTPIGSTGSNKGEWPFTEEMINQWNQNVLVTSELHQFTKEAVDKFGIRITELEKKQLSFAS
jgi:hypothetical protein